MLISRVLLVDDDDDIRMVAEYCLREVAGWDVGCAASGWEALRTLATESFDLILLDVMMPGLDGLATLQKIRDDLHCETPVVFLTAKIRPSEVQQYTDAGASGVVSKPFDPMTLHEELLRLIAD